MQRAFGPSPPPVDQMVRPLEQTALIDGNQTWPAASKSWSDLSALPSCTRLNSSSSQCRGSSGIQG